jgi:hypothetical protein
MAEKATDAVEAPPEPIHVATFATDKRKPGKYNIRVIGPTAGVFSGRTVPVTHKDHSKSMEELTTCFWLGVDEETGTPVALYHFVEKPREEKTEELPF